MLSGEATHTNFIVFALIRPGLEPTIYRTRGEHANHSATDAVTMIVDENVNTTCVPGSSLNTWSFHAYIYISFPTYYNVLYMSTSYIFAFRTELWYLSPLSIIFSYIVAVSFIGGGNRSIRRKPSTCSKSLSNFIAQCCIEYTPTSSEFCIRFYVVVSIKSITTFSHWLD